MGKLLSQLVILALSGLLLAACTQETPTSEPTTVPFDQLPPTVEFNLFPVEATNPVGASHTITATVKVDGKPVAGVTVTFTIISGPHAVQTFTAITDANGDASFTYPGTNAGVDTIVAEAAIEGAVTTSNKARKEWVGEEPTPLGEVFVYPAKFVCGSIPVEASPAPPNEPPLKPGNYATAINLYNYQSQDVKFTKKAVIANPQGQPSGATSPVFTESLGAGLALEVDCSNITQMLSHSEGGKSLPAFIKGFVVVESPVELQVVGVYTASGPEGRATECTAAPIMLNTGLLPNGSLIPDGQPDDDWDMINAPVGVPLGNAKIADPFSPFGGPPLTNSRWISLSDGTLGFGTAASEVTYQFQFPVNPGCTAAKLSFDYLIQISFGVPKSTATWFLNGVQIAGPGGDHIVPTNVLFSAPVNIGTNILTVVIGEIAAVAPGLDVAGTVTFSGAGGVAPNTSIDVEYIQPKIVRRGAESPTEGTPDLAIAKAQRGEFPFGGTGAYVITVKNVGDGTADSPIIVLETLPFGFNFIPGSANPPWSCTVVSPVVNPATDQEKLECTYPGTLLPGGGLTLTIEVKINPVAVRPPGPNCAQVKHTDDPNPDNNESCIETVLAPSSQATPTSTPAPAPLPTSTPRPTPTPTGEKPDLAIEKFLNSKFHYGQSGSYTFQVSNIGQGSASSPITVVDKLPDGFTYVSYLDPYSTDWACTASGQQVTCTYTGPDIAPGGFLPTLIINLMIAPIDRFPGGSDAVENCAGVKHAEDANSDNNLSCVTTIITPSDSAA